MVERLQINLWKPFKSVDNKINTCLNQVVVDSSRVLFDLNDNSCSVNVKIILKANTKAQKNKFHTEIP